MGDRANVKVIQSEGATPLYLYTHWSGFEWNQSLSDALAFGKSRWTDPAYLTRILISRMYSDLVNDRTGGGIGVDYMPDNEHSVIVVDIAKQEVYLEGTTERESFESFSSREHPELDGWPDEDDEGYDDWDGIHSIREA